MVTRKFPAFSETFMMRAIAGLMERGHEVDVYAFKRSSDNVVQGTIKRLRLMERVRYLHEIPGERWPRIMGALPLLLKGANKPYVWRAMNIWRYGSAGLASRIYWLNCPPEGSAYDIIHCHSGEYGIAAAWWREAGLLTGKIVTTFQGLDVNRSQYRSNAYRILFQKGDRFTANSRFTADNAVKFGCPQNRLEILPLGIDLERYEFHERHIPITGPVTFLTVSRLVEHKGIDYSIRAFAKVANQRADVCYSIAGDGPERPRLQRLIDELGVADRVELLGWKTEEELRAVYRDAHVFVMASTTSCFGHQEARGMVLQEAQACGLPVLSTRIGGIPENVIDGKTGYLVAEQDADSLAERMMYLLDHPETLAEMSRAARRFIESMNEANSPVNRLIEIYESLIEGSAQVVNQVAK